MTTIIKILECVAQAINFVKIGHVYLAETRDCEISKYWIEIADFWAFELIYYELITQRVD